MNYYSYSAFEIVEKELKNKIIGSRINNITVINSHDFLFTFSRIKEERLLISLNHQHPFLSLINIDKVAPTLSGTLNENLRKYLRGAFIVSIALENRDRLLHFVLEKTNDYYEIEKRHLYLEFISHRPNMIITDDKQIILYAFRYSPLTSDRPLLNNLIYNYPTSLDFKDEEAPNITAIKKQAQIYFEEALLKQKKEQFLPLYRYIKSRIKTLDKKFEVLDKEILEAKNNLIYIDYGNAILSLLNDRKNLEIYLKENEISLDESRSLVANANLFFKKYKKSKKTIEMNKVEYEKAQKEKTYLTYLLASSQYMNDEELLSLTHELLPKKRLKKKAQPIKYSYINYENIRIYFGKNAASNHELTFKFAHQDDYFLHIKDYSGAHVIIRHPRPSDEVKLVAAEICLILSHKSTGEVTITPVKNVKKGSALGEAILLSYQTIVIKSVRESTISLLRNKINQ
ncbi:MAG TPA: DUF814 domain-containing protein [Erysipelotrichaceae bacterium]|nr:DUF814 domain-containing protein [Erysipelotrichaceae bacterium]